MGRRSVHFHLMNGEKYQPKGWDTCPSECSGHLPSGLAKISKFFFLNFVKNFAHFKMDPSKGIKSPFDHWTLLTAKMILVGGCPFFVDFDCVLQSLNYAMFSI